MQTLLTGSLGVSEQDKARADVQHDSGGNGKQTGGSHSEGASVVVVKRSRGRPRKVYRL